MRVCVEREWERDREGELERVSGFGVKFYPPHTYSQKNARASLESNQ